MTRAAFFDIDGTLVNCVTQEILAQVLRNEGILKFSHAVRIFTWFLLYKLGLTNGSENLRRSVYSVFEVRQKEEMDAIFKRAQEIITSHIRWQMKSIVDEHIHRGDLVVAISGSLHNLCQPICSVFGISMQYSTILKITNNRYTRFWENDAYEGEKKLRLIKELEQSYHLSLKDSSSYADSYSDLPMLQVVGNPTVVSPDYRLRRYALSKNWKILEVC